MKTITGPNTHTKVVIRTSEELVALASVSSLFKRYTKVILDINGMDSADQQKYEEQLNRFYSACGCSEGKFFVLLGFLTFLCYSYYSNSTEITWLNAGKGFLFCMVGAAVGKLFGIHRAHLKLRKLIGEMVECGWFLKRINAW